LCSRSSGNFNTNLLAGTGALLRRFQAIAWLERAYAAHSNGLTALKVDPTYDPLRGDPEFQNLLRVGLVP